MSITTSRQENEPNYLQRKVLALVYNIHSFESFDRFDWHTATKEEACGCGLPPEKIFDHLKIGNGKRKLFTNG